MKAAVATAFGEPDTVIRMATDRPKPSIQPGKVLVHVHACSLSPGDYRTISGDVDYFRTPASWPYVPGGDVCGAIPNSGIPLHPPRRQCPDLSHIPEKWYEFVVIVCRCVDQGPVEVDGIANNEAGMQARWQKLSLIHI